MTQYAVCIRYLVQLTGTTVGLDAEMLMTILKAWRPYTPERIIARPPDLTPSYLEVSKSLGVPGRHVQSSLHADSAPVVTRSHSHSHSLASR